MIDCPDSTALPSRRTFLNGGLRLAAIIGGVSLLIASTRRSASAAHSRKPEMIEELDAESMQFRGGDHTAAVAL